MSFCTAVNCMDGRVQLPVIQYLQKKFGVRYVDSITEPGPILALAQRDNAVQIDAILGRLSVSVDKHHSVGIAVVGHHDCTGNPAPYEEQLRQIRKSIHFLRGRYPAPTIIGLWVDHEWNVHELPEDDG